MIYDSYHIGVEQAQANGAKVEGCEMDVGSDNLSDAEEIDQSPQTQIVTYRDCKGWERFLEPERQRRVDAILRDGQPVHIAITLWPHLRKDQDESHDLWVVEFHPSPGFVHMAANYQSGPWEGLVPNGGYHMSLATLGEVSASAALTRDLQDVIEHLEGRSGNIMIHRVHPRTCTFINSWYCPILGGVWHQLRRLRQASTHPGPLTISA